MTQENFTAVMDEIFKHEGGYVNHSKDPGGETNFGISKRSYPRVNIKGLTKNTAGNIYRRDFWPKAKGDFLPDGLDLVSMDGSVNSGPKRGAKWLQRGIGVKADGSIGPKTIEAAFKADLLAIQRACAARMGFLRGLRTWTSFGKGWSRRVASVEAVGVSMWLKTYESATSLVPSADKPRAVLVAEAQTADAKSKSQGKASASTAGGGAVGGTGAEAYGVEPWMIAVGIAVLLLGVVVLWGQSRNDRNRAEAYQNEAIKIGV